MTTGLSPASAVLVDANGQLGTMASSRRYEEDIQVMGTARGLLRLRPVTFRYKKAHDDGSKAYPVPPRRRGGGGSLS